MKLKRSILAVIAIILICVAVINYNWTKTYVCTIDKMDIKINGFNKKGAIGSSTYMIYTELDNGNVRVFEDRDYLLRFKFNSSDIYGLLVPGKKYKVRVVGWRIPFLSYYENIISTEEIN